MCDIRIVNRYAGDNWALRSTLFGDIENRRLTEFSVLDLGAGSGELLRTCGKFARSRGIMARLCGLELNEWSASSIIKESKGFEEISSVQADALNPPFGPNSFDYVICSLFTHHFHENEIGKLLVNMSRIASKRIFVIDLHRHPFASLLYKGFCALFIKGVLVKTDGALSIKRGFKPEELEQLAEAAKLVAPTVKRRFPYRLVLEADSAE